MIPGTLDSQSSLTVIRPVFVQSCAERQQLRRAIGDGSGMWRAQAS